MEIPGKCVVGATRQVVPDGKMVRIMIRLAGEEGDASTALNDGAITGWLFMHDTDDDVDDVPMQWLESVLPSNPHIAAYLHTPAPCRFDWSDEDEAFIRVEWE